MKGGKGGMGRKRMATRTPAKPQEKARDLPKRGVAKKDWGAIPRDDDAAPPGRNPRKK